MRRQIVDIERVFSLTPIGGTDERFTGQFRYDAHLSCGHVAPISRYRVERAVAPKSAWCDRCAAEKGAGLR